MAKSFKTGISVDGSVGIGTTSPDDELHVVGDVKFEVSDDGSAAQPEVTLHRESASPADGDYLGQFKFSGKNDADQTVNYAKVTGKISDATDTTEDGLIEIATVKAGSQNIGYRLTSTDLKLINGTGLQVDGDVGIGTTSPAEPLHVVTASGDAYLRQDNGTATTYLGPDGSNTGLFGTSTAHDVRFITDNTERVRIDTSGNVGIGNSSPTQELDVTGTVTATALAVTGQFTLPTADGTADQVLVTNGSGTVSWADQSGGGGSSTPSGAVMMYGGGTAPSGWLVCDGSAVSRTTYADLFTAIGTRYGTGDGSTTFNLPGTSALVPVGIAASGNADGTTVSGSSALNALALGDQSADHAHTITSNAGNQSANHNHTITSNAGNQSANHSHTITVANANANHRHSWSKNFNTTNQNASHTHGYLKSNGSNTNANTNNQNASHSHNFNSGTVNTNYANAGHNHNASSGNQSANHNHTITSNAGNQSANHNHTITSNAGNQSANHNHALTSATVSTTINVEPFLFIIKT